MFGYSVLTLAANNISKTMDLSVPLVERLKNGVEILVLGVVIVFSVLVVIWLLLEFLSWVFSRDLKKDSSSTSNTTVDTQTESTVSDNQCVASADSDDCLVAVITAAVAACIDAEDSKKDEESKLSFKVVSFKRLG